MPGIAIPINEFRSLTTAALVRMHMADRKAARMDLSSALCVHRFEYVIRELNALLKPAFAWLIKNAPQGNRCLRKGSPSASALPPRSPGG